MNLHAQRFFPDLFAVDPFHVIFTLSLQKYRLEMRGKSVKPLQIENAEKNAFFVFPFAFLNDWHQFYIFTYHCNQFS